MFKHAPYGTWKCDQCNLVFKTRSQLYTHRYEVHPVKKGCAWNKGLTKETDPRIKKYVDKCKAEGKYRSPIKGQKMPSSTKQKISSACKAFYQSHPELIPYKLHHSSKESYPEKYFRELFEKETIEGIVQEFPVGRYSLDFAIPSLMIDIEIDGSQHINDKRIIEHDKTRNKYLSDLGWKIIRINWSEWQKMSRQEKIEFISKLKNISKKYWLN